MNRLFQLIYRYRAFLIFLFLELVCYWLMVSSNPYHSASFFHSSNQLAGGIYKTKDGFTDYFQLKKINTALADENARLRERYFERSQTIIVSRQIDSTKIPDVNIGYDFLAAKVINNSVNHTHNHFTLNKGEKQGIKRGMGVIGPNGVVGIVRSVSNNFSTAYSLLNNKVFVSAQLKNKETLCTVNWNGKDPYFASVLYVPRHVKISQGDSVLTSGFNSIFPENILIGVVEEVTLSENASFYTIKMALASDFYSLSYVYVINNDALKEKDELEALKDE